MSELMELKLAEARDALRSGDTTAVDLTDASLAAIEESKPLTAFVRNTPEIARERAIAADIRL